MKRKLVLSMTSILLLWLITGCGNTNTKEIKTGENKTEPSKQEGIPTVSFVLDGRLIETTDYSCSWILSGNQNIFNLTVHYDRVPKQIPPSTGFNIYNLKDITLPFIPVHGNKLTDKSKQLFSLGANMGFQKGKPANMNEQSFSDNYAGLGSKVQLNLLDTSIKIVSGNFEGTIKNANGKTLSVTKGKFERIPLTMVYNTNLY